MSLASVALRSSLKFCRFQPSSLQLARNAHAWKRKRYYRGVFFNDGMECHRGDELARQWKLNYYPGLNVSFSQEMNDQVLRAMCDGTVMITTEQIEPDFAFPDIETVYGWRKEQVDAGVTKLTFNVVPVKEVGKFRLKEMI